MVNILTQLKAAATAVRTANSAFFAPQPSRFLFVSPLADGADQIAAELALGLGFELQAVLPFEQDRYRASLPDDGARQQFDSLIAKASCVLELPGDTNRPLDAYVMAGRATMAHSDLLIAVWDGLPPRGRGGTGEVVALAIADGTPLVHVPVDDSGTTKVSWSAYDPYVVTRAPDRAVERLCGPELLQKLLTALLAPPPDSRERAFLMLFQRERSREWRLRLEYPLLLALAGVSRLGSKDWRNTHCSAFTRTEWQRYRENCCCDHELTPPLDPLEDWYDCTDRMATHFAQSYRSGQVFNFVSAAMAILIALSALIVPQFKAYLATAEFTLIVGILANTTFGKRWQWHRRWLDYRQLAERLRPMRSLKLLAIARPDPPGSETTPIASRWIDWYAAAVWRATGCPVGRLAPSAIQPLARAIACHELWPQIDYHRSSAAQIHRLDHRLERFATAIFTCSLIGCVVLLIALVVDKHWVEENFNWFTIASAGLPAIGAAIFGIRYEGDFGGSAVRSETTANTLEQIAVELTQNETELSRAADLLEQAARAMLSDLDEWRLLNQQHNLSVG